MSLKKDAAKINNKIKVVESDSVNDNIKEIIPIIKNNSGRPKKENLFKKERQEVLNKLNNILKITNDNQKFYMCDIDEPKQKQIMDLKNDVKKYFTSKSYNVFVKSDDMERNYLSLIKLIFKEMKIKLTRTPKSITRDGKSIKTACYLLNVE
jgi:hypothetical protein